MTLPSTFNLTPNELVIFHECLSSKVCIRIFQALLTNRSLNVSAISRKAGCNNDRCIEYLKKMIKLNMAEEEFYAGRHSFALKKGALTDLMEQTIRLMKKGEKTDGTSPSDPS